MSDADAAVGQVAIIDPAQKQERCGRAIRRAMQGDPNTWSRFSTADSATDSNRSQAENLAAEVRDLLLDYEFGMILRGILSCVESSGQGRQLVGGHLSTLVQAASWSSRRVDWGLPVAGIYVPRKESDLSVLQALVDKLEGEPSFKEGAAAAERIFQTNLLTTWVASIPAKLDPNEDTRTYETVLTCMMTKDPRGVLTSSGRAAWPLRSRTDPVRNPAPTASITGVPHPTRAVASRARLADGLCSPAAKRLRLDSSCLPCARHDPLALSSLPSESGSGPTHCFAAGSGDHNASPRHSPSTHSFHDETLNRDSLSKRIRDALRAIAAGDIDRPPRSPTIGPEADSSVIQAAIKQFACVFDDESRYDKALRPCRAPPHVIALKDGYRVITMRPRPLSGEKEAFAYAQVAKMLRAGVIRQSRSPWASPIVIAHKPGPDGFRFCADWRRVNVQTIPDRTSLPMIDGLHDSLRGCTFFTSLDLTSSYWQLELDESSRPITAFIMPQGELFEYCRCGMGLRNSQAVLVKAVAGTIARTGSAAEHTRAFADDLLLATDRDFAHHWSMVTLLLTALQQDRWTVKLRKCHFGVPQLPHLGLQVCGIGKRIQPATVAAATGFPRPTTVKKAEQFLGLVGAYQKFVEQYSARAAPLRAIMKKSREDDGSPLEWNPIAVAAFNDLRTALVGAPLLRHWDPALPTTLRTDACAAGYGAVLRQYHPDGWHPVAYLSRVTSPAEARYHSHKLETGCILWAMDKLKHLLLPLHFTLESDARNLVWLLRQDLDSGQFARWAILLSQYDFALRPRPGREIPDADALSRNATTNLLYLSPSPVLPAPAANPSLAELIAAQQRDPDLATIRSRIISSTPSKSDNNYYVLDGCLHHTQPSADGLLHQVVVPVDMRKQFLHNYHNSAFAGHRGRSATLKALTFDYYWPGVAKDVRQWCKCCHECQRAKAIRRANVGHHRNLEADDRFSHVSVDLCGPYPLSQKGYRYMLVAMCLYSSYLLLVPIPDKTARTVASALLDAVICKHGAPAHWLSDRGKEFLNEIMASLSKLLATRHLKTSGYNPQTNGMNERSHRVLVAQLKIFVGKHQTTWDQWLPAFEFCFNTTKFQESPTLTPYFLLHGRHPRLPQDILSDKHMFSATTPVPDSEELSAFASDLTKKIKAAGSEIRPFDSHAPSVPQQLGLAHSRCTWLPIQNRRLGFAVPTRSIQTRPQWQNVVAIQWSLENHFPIC